MLESLSYVTQKPMHNCIKTSFCIVSLSSRTCLVTYLAASTSDSDSDDLFTSKPSKPKQKSKKNTQEMSKNDTPDQQTSDIPEIRSVEPIIVKPPIKKTKLFDQSSDEDVEHQSFEKSVKQKDSPDSISNKVPESKGKDMDFLKLGFSIYFGKVVPQKAC